MERSLGVLDSPHGENRRRGLLASPLGDVVTLRSRLFLGRARMATVCTSLGMV